MSAALIEAPVSDFTLEVYSKPACVQCDATKRKLAQKNTAYKLLDATITANREMGLALGVMSAPLVIVRNADGSIADFWGGNNPPKLVEWDAKLDRQQAVAAA
ncbi:glutaredoxin family protein [Arthrobacter sp. 2MCAF14]|uniref:glutaredoxin family protein n=1 Tax=Arthrobacter sp. 2MCAF14 TaxID=3232982 RepID=UPI003F90CFD3